MIKKIVVTSLVTAALILSGCGDSSDAEKRLSAQQNLDKGNFTSTITSLEAKTVKSDEDKMVLASSYLGAAGFSFTETVGLVSTSSQNSASSDTFSNFVGEVEKKKDTATLDNLQKAIDYYKEIGVVLTAAPAFESTTRAIATTTSTIAEVGARDLFLSLAYMTKATVVFGYLGDVSNIQAAVKDKELLASACAITSVYSPTSPLPTGCSSVVDTLVSIDDTTYKKYDIILDNDGTVYSRLGSLLGNDIILTDHKKPLVPILINNNQVTVADVLVDTINNAFELFGDTLPDDLKKNVDAFKAEIGTTNGKITASDLAKYLAK